MKFFDFLFGKEEKGTEEEEEQAENSLTPLEEGDVRCYKCFLPIKGHEPRKRLAGKSLHRKCFKKMKKEVLK